MDVVTRMQNFVSKSVPTPLHYVLEMELVLSLTTLVPPPPASL